VVVTHGEDKPCLYHGGDKPRLYSSSMSIDEVYYYSGYHSQKAFIKIEDITNGTKNGSFSGGNYPSRN
jgi:hypothetical protein